MLHSHKTKKEAATLTLDHRVGGGVGCAGSLRSTKPGVLQTPLQKSNSTLKFFSQTIFRLKPLKASALSYITQNYFIDLWDSRSL